MATMSKIFRESVSVQQIQRLDRQAIHKVGIPSIVLMENAGRAVAEEVLRCLKRLPSGRVSVVCGTGGNGGDGFVAGRWLRDAGIRPGIFLAGDPKDLRPDAALHYQILKNLKYPVQVLRGRDPVTQKFIRRSDLIVDALFGVGLNREILDPARDIIETINEAGRFVVSVDIPSGLDGTSGKIYGVCVKASFTVTFSFSKKGFFLNQGPRHVGRIVVRDIGIPKLLMKKPLLKLVETNRDL